MGRAPCCAKVGLNKGKWTPEEDKKLVSYIKANGEGSWRSLPKNAGLLRCGKSCRLRWINYLRDDLKRGNISPEEEDTIIKLQASMGNRWSLIATHLPGRTDNEIKNHWNSHLSRKIQSENPPVRKKRGRKPKATTGPKNDKPVKKRKKSSPNEEIGNAGIIEQQEQPRSTSTTTTTTTSTCCNTPECGHGETSSGDKRAAGSIEEEKTNDIINIGDLEGLLLDDNLWDEVNCDLWPAGFSKDIDVDFQPDDRTFEYIVNDGGFDQLEGNENLERWLQSSDFFISNLF